jgi:hypothetical protein
MKTLALFLLISGTAAAQSAEVKGTVTLHVKDEDVVDILKSMKKQCGVRNMVIDKDVAGKGTIYFKDVPCGTAFRVVFRQFGLAGQPDPALMFVETRKSR